jgi:hypothetical protein
MVGGMPFRVTVNRHSPGAISSSGDTTPFSLDVKYVNDLMTGEHAG